MKDAPHRFGGTEFLVKGLEFMHPHGPSYLDIRLSKDDQKRMLEEGKAEQYRFAPQAGWVTFRIRSAEDIERAKELVTLAYENARRAAELHESHISQDSAAGPA